MILTKPAPYAPFMEARTARAPGLCPLDDGEWTVVHDDFAAQMAYRRTLLAREADTVLACLPEGAAPARELLGALLSHLKERAEYSVGDAAATRPDGGVASIDVQAPLPTIGELVPEDFCLLLPDPGSGEYRLVAAVLCFPSRWLLGEKMGRPLTIIHDPVPEYDGGLARRVNRVFETLRPGRGLVRCNWLIHTDPELFLPVGRETKRVARTGGCGPLYLRTERQTLVRLPETGAVAFGIKSSVSPVTDLAPEVLAGLTRTFADKVEEDTADGDSIADRRRTLARLEHLCGREKEDGAAHAP